MDNEQIVNKILRDAVEARLAMVLRAIDVHSVELDACETQLSHLRDSGARYYAERDALQQWLDKQA